MRDGFPVRFGTSARGIAQHPNDVVNFAPAVMRGAFFCPFTSIPKDLSADFFARFPGPK